VEGDGGGWPVPLGIGAQRKPSAECILMVVSLPPPRGYRFSEAAAALNAAGVLALPSIVSASTPTPRRKVWTCAGS